MGTKHKTQSLRSRQAPLASPVYQLKVIKSSSVFNKTQHSFENRLKTHNRFPLRARAIDILQINVGKLCNQTCAHCHVDAGPDKKDEQMSLELFEKCLDLLKTGRIGTVDLTGGAPEMNVHFRWFVEECSKLNVKIMVRCNLTIITANKKYNDLPDFFKKHGVHVISSLPHYNKHRTDAQRGDGVFEASIDAIKRLNAVGYGDPQSGLVMDLVYNPTGAFLPDDQCTLEAEFKRQLKRKHDISFNQLFVITNMPISRYLDYLVATNNYESYMQLLVDAFNPATIDGLMCLNTLSVSWDGYLYDCDFNQMVDVKVNAKGKHLLELDIVELLNREIVVNEFCYGCTAGAGSSCGGELV